jgi:hypothetical protein
MAPTLNLSPSAGRATKARVPSRASSIRPDVDTHVMLAVVCGAGLLIVTLLATYGLDLRVGLY